MNSKRVMEEMSRLKTNLFLWAGIDCPSVQDAQLAEEALKYANPKLWKSTPKTLEEWAGKKEFEIKAYSYFMRQKFLNNVKMIGKFTEYEKTHLENIHFVLKRSQTAI